jgi:glycolate oxidase
VVPRGAGTGLAGGAIPVLGGVVLSLNRMDRLLSVDAENRLAWVQSGLVNLSLSEQVAPLGLCFAPDPSSQQVSTVGGNVAANAGGPHCLKYGVTWNHVLGLVVVLADGSVARLGGPPLDAPDLDLASVITGSEGTLAVITEIAVRLLPRAEAVRTMLFDFATIEESGNAVSDVIAAGIVPAALEIMDWHTVQVVEDWLHLGLPRDAGAVLLVELEGPAVSMATQVERIGAIAAARNARHVRVAQSEEERAQIWRGRKSAFGAYGRTGRGFYIMDGVVPRTRLAEALAEVQRIAAHHGVEAGNVFHAGDGNLHPHVLFDAGSEAARARALQASHDILRMCIRLGGTISGEHGVGLEKRSMMNELYAPDDLALMERLRRAFDPDARLNPGKVLPTGGACDEAAAAVAAHVQGEGLWI